MSKEIKQVLLTGQCSLHQGRMEFGNIGNFYIVEPLVRELHKAFPNADVVTTFQMSEDFCIRENVRCLPLESYYGWTLSDLPKSVYEVSATWINSRTPLRLPSTCFMRAVRESDLVIDFSGDIWSDNADLVGRHRFLVGLLKDVIGQLQGKPVILLAGSPGPFKTSHRAWLAKRVFRNFALVTNREPTSTRLLKQWGFDLSNVKTLACPAFLFEGLSDEEIAPLLRREGLNSIGRPIVGFILCGWNMREAPFSKWPRADTEFAAFADAVEHIVDSLGCTVVLMSHSNGFKRSPQFKMTHGRDYPYAKRLCKIMRQRGYESDKVMLLSGIYSPAETKAVLRQFDMLVTGRIHAACAALSERVPTVVVDYGHAPKAHKLVGFAEVAGVEEYVASPELPGELTRRIDSCWRNRKEIAQQLSKKIPEVQREARRNFSELQYLVTNRR